MLLSRVGRSKLTAMESQREQQHARDEPYPLTPTRVNGVDFGRVRDLIDIAVDSTDGDLTVWAFAANGMAYVWQLDGGPKAITRRIVLNDGTVAPEKDLDDDGRPVSRSQRAYKRVFEVHPSLRRMMDQNS